MGGQCPKHQNSYAISQLAGKSGTASALATQNSTAHNAFIVVSCGGFFYRVKIMLSLGKARRNMPQLRFFFGTVRADGAVQRISTQQTTAKRTPPRKQPQLDVF